MEQNDTKKEKGPDGELKQDLEESTRKRKLPGRVMHVRKHFKESIEEIRNDLRSQINDLTEEYGDLEEQMIKNQEKARALEKDLYMTSSLLDDDVAEVLQMLREKKPIGAIIAKLKEDGGPHQLQFQPDRASFSTNHFHVEILGNFVGETPTDEYDRDWEIIKTITKEIKKLEQRNDPI